MDHKVGKIADDILISAEAISEETGLTERQVYAKQKELGLTHLGGLLIGSKSELKKRLTGKSD
jgi:hypothetical protein